MNEKIPTIRQTSWISIIPQIFVMTIIMFICRQITPEKGLLIGAITYLLISFLLRKLIPKDFRNGSNKINHGDFEGGIKDFKKSYDFFKKNEWLDKYRYVTLLSSSKNSYREMSLNNIAFSYGQIGNGEKAKEYYKKMLSEFPTSQLAKVALNMIKTFDK